MPGSLGKKVQLGLDPALQGRWAHKQHGNEKWWIWWNNWACTRWQWLNLVSTGSRKVSRETRGDLELAWERWTGIHQADEGACHALKSECVTPGVWKEGNDLFLLSSIIAAYDHISLFGSHSTQLAHRGLKPLSFLHCFATSPLIVHASESLLLIKETKASPELLHLSLLDHRSLVLENTASSPPHSVWEPLHLHQSPRPPSLMQLLQRWHSS